MKVPLTDEQAEVIRSMPRTPAGHVINPRYAERPWAEDYIRRLGEWCRNNPKQLWPDWLTEYVNDRRREASGSSRTFLDRMREATERAGTGDAAESGGVSGS